MSEAPRLRRAEWVGQVLDVGTGTVYALAREGVIPSVRVGRGVRFREHEILEWIDRGGAGLPGGWRREPLAK